VTPPYMHDGSLLNLRAVLRHYRNGGTVTENGPNAGDGRESPLKS
jgi:cytochrome c peroxidase